MKQGKNVFMEKPVATDAPGIRQVLAAAEEAKKKNLKVGVGLQRHHEAKYIETVKRIQDGALGELDPDAASTGTAPASGSARASRARPKWNTRCATGTTSSGSAAITSSSSTSTTSTSSTGSRTATPSRPRPWAAARSAPASTTAKSTITTCVEFTYADGTVLISQCRHIPGCWNSVSEHAHGTKGYADIGGGLFTMKQGQGENWKYKGPNVDPYQVEHDDLFDAIRNNKPYNEAEYGASSTMTVHPGPHGNLLRPDHQVR